MRKIVQAAFLANNGTIYGTGPFHDTNQLPEGAEISQEGFITSEGEFLTRDQAASERGMDHPARSEDVVNKAEDKEREWREHEFQVVVEQWLARRRRGMTKSEGVEGLLFAHNLIETPSQSFHEAAHHMGGFDYQSSADFQAAKFLSGGKELASERVREALVTYDENLELAALYAYGVPRTEDNLRALRSVKSVQGLRKGEIDVAAIPRIVEPGDPSAQPCAEALRRAFGVSAVHPVHFNGKHSKGMAIAVDPRGKKHYLVKPGSGPLSPAAGVAEEHASQSRREVAFAKIAQIMGLGAFVPDCELITLDGQEVAVMELMPLSFKGVDSRKQSDEGFNATKVLEPYRQDGTLFKWATLDMLLGNPDRHAGNVLVSDDNKVCLIDHGSAFAGPSFDPVHDSKSFVPYYLRAWSSSNMRFLSPAERLRRMPRPPVGIDAHYRAWLQDVNTTAIKDILRRYGLQEYPVEARLKMLATDDALLTMLKFWAGASESGLVKSDAVGLPEDHELHQAWALGRNHRQELMGQGVNHPNANAGWNHFDLPPWWGSDTSTGHAHFYAAGIEGHDLPRKVNAWRYGEPPSGDSVNHREQRRERGVSVMAIEGAGDQTDGTFALFNSNRPKVKVSGYLLPWRGSDGEPLLTGVTKQTQPGKRTMPGAPKMPRKQKA